MANAISSMKKSAKVEILNMNLISLHACKERLIHERYVTKPLRVIHLFLNYIFEEKHI